MKFSLSKKVVIGLSAGVLLLAIAISPIPRVTHDYLVCSVKASSLYDRGTIPYDVMFNSCLFLERWK